MWASPRRCCRMASHVGHVRLATLLCAVLMFPQHKSNCSGRPSSAHHWPDCLWRHHTSDAFAFTRHFDTLCRSFSTVLRSTLSLLHSLTHRCRFWYLHWPREAPCAVVGRVGRHQFEFSAWPSVVLRQKPVKLRMWATSVGCSASTRKFSARIRLT